MALTLPEHLKNSRHRAALQIMASEATQSIGTGSLPRISIRNNNWTIYDANGNAGITLGTLYIDVIVIGVNPNMSKIYYKDEFDPDATTYKRPDCWSDNGMGPSRQVSEPVYHLCGPCPMNRFGSAKSKQTGKDIKACNDRLKIAVLLPFTIPGTTEPVKTPFQMILPYISQANWKDYCDQIEKARLDDGQAITLGDLVTRISFDPKGKMGTMLFDFGDFVSPAWAEVRDHCLDQDLAEVLTGRKDEPGPATIAAVEAKKITHQPAQTALAGAHPNADAAHRAALEAEAAAQAEKRRLEAEAAAARQAEQQATPQQGEAASESLAGRARRTGTRAPRAATGQAAPPPTEARNAPFGQGTTIPGGAAPSGGTVNGGALSSSTTDALKNQLGNLFNK